MYCSKCGKEIPNNNRFCPFCGTDLTVGQAINVQANNPPVNQQPVYYANPQPNQNIVYTNPNNRSNKNKKRNETSVAVLVGIFIFLGVIFTIGRGSKKDDSNVKITDEGIVVEITNDSDIEEDNAKEVKGGNEVDSSINVASDFENMKLGDIGKADDIYISLNYAKRMYSIPTAVESDPIDADKEIIVGFFEAYNCSGSEQRVNFNNISCYVDGIKVAEPETIWKVKCDGISQFYFPSLCNNYKAMSVQDFEVPKEWKELKFYYNSECVWTLTQDDVSEEAYNHISSYDVDAIFAETDEESVVYDDNFQLTYTGKEVYVYHNSVWGDTSYIVFKFIINNTGNTALDYSLAGYEMQAYGGLYLLDDASYTLDEKIDDYINVFEIESLEKGMSAYVYVAFPITEEADTYYMIYDDGYITNEKKAEIFVLSDD